MSGKPALSLKYEPEDYLCTWNIPTGTGEATPLPGSLEVRPDLPPKGTIYGDVPVEWTKNEGGGSRAGFPQAVDADVLTGTLASGGKVVILDARVRYWGPGHGTLSGSAAILRGDYSNVLVGMAGARPPEPDNPDEPLYTVCRVQMTALDAVLGEKPIRTGLLPHPKAAEWTWSATYDKDSSLAWDDDYAKLKVEYRNQANNDAGYQLNVRFSPTADIMLLAPQPLRTFLQDWVQPLRKVLSIATGQPETVTYLAVGGSEDRGHAMGQVFGTAIAQEPYESTSTGVREKASAIRCHEDSVSLLSLVRRWNALAEDHHPLIETYGAMLSVPDRHPRSRFLLLIQAIEGMYGYEARDARQVREASYVTQRDEFLARVTPLLGPEDKKFLTRRLSKHLPAGLDEALITVITGLPINLMDVIADTNVIKELKNAPNVNTTPEALRLLRNHLAHGEKGHDVRLLNEVVKPLERVVRAHSLRLLGCPDTVLRRVLDPSS